MSLLPPEAQGIPVIDLTALLNDLGAEALRLRGQANKVRHDADLLATSLTRQADYIASLTMTLRGVTRGD